MNTNALKALLKGATTLKGTAILFIFTFIFAAENNVMLGLCCYSFLIACMKIWFKKD